MKQFNAAVATLLLGALPIAALPACAGTITGTYSNDGDPDNQATGFPGGPFGLTSTSATYSYVDFIPNQTFTLGDMTSLSATFTDLLGGSNGGAPRFYVGLNTGEFIDVYLGTPPNFDVSDPTTFTTAFSGFNLINGTNDSAYENTGSYATFASLLATYGTDTVTDIALVVDGGWTANGEQSLTLDSINVDANVQAVPEPGALALLLAGLGLLGLAALRRRTSS